MCGVQEVLALGPVGWIWIPALVPVSRAAAAAAKSLQLCPTLCDPIDGSPPGSPVPGILQARTLGWVAISFSNSEKWEVKVKSLSRVRLFATPWTAAHQAPLSMGFSRQEHWSGVPLPSPVSGTVSGNMVTYFGTSIFLFKIKKIDSTRISYFRIKDLKLCEIITQIYTHTFSPGATV